MPFGSLSHWKLVGNSYSSFLQVQPLPDHESGHDGALGAGLGVRETVLVIARGLVGVRISDVPGFSEYVCAQPWSRLIRKAGPWCFGQQRERHSFQVPEPSPIEHRLSQPAGLLARRNRGTIDDQVDAITIVAVSPASSGDPYVYFNSYARTQVTSECGLIGLTSLNLATWKFPQTGKYTRRASLCNEIASVPLDQAGYNAKVRHESIHESLEG